MRIRTLLSSCLLVLAVGSCKSTDKDASTEPTNPDLNEPGSSAFLEGDDEPSTGAFFEDEEPVLSDGGLLDETEGFEDSTFPSTTAGAPLGQDTMDEAADRIRRQRERAEYLATEYIQRGDELLDRADLQAALQEYAQALEVMPTNDDARQKLRRVQALMGDQYAQAEDYIEDAVQRETVRRAQATLAAEEAATEGDNFIRMGDFDQAIESYRRAETILRYNPLIASGSLDERVIGEKLQTALQLAEESEREAARIAQEDAERERQTREQEQRQYRENKLRTLYAEANSYFHREKYGTAESLAEQILLLDAGNEAATELRDIAQAARHQKTNLVNMRRYRENWIRTFEDLETMGAPQSEVIVWDDLDRWKAALEAESLTFENDPVDSADREAILKRLGDLTIRPVFGEDGEGAPLEEIASYLQQVTGVNFLISSAVTDLDEDETSVYLDLNERSVRKVLDIISEVRENVSWKVEDGVVKFVTPEELIGGQILQMYEVRDLIRPVTDFPGGEMNVNPSGGPPDLDEDLPEREPLVINEDNLDALIRENVAPDSWTDDPNNALRISAGTMVVNQTPEVHDQIKALLDDLREATSIMVDIQSRFLKVSDNFLEDIGVDFRGLGSPGLGSNEFFNDFGDPTTQQTLGREIGNDSSVGAFYDDGDDGNVRGRVENLYDSSLGDEDILTNSGGLALQWTYLNDLELEMILRAVSKSERVELVTAPRVLVFNTARSNLTVVNQTAYVADFDVEIAQAASIADPVVDVVEEGVILDVRPVVSADRRFITLELRPTVAELQRPIENFTTSLGVSGNSVTIQLPELEVSRVRTSIPMPDGGTVLLGGFKIHESQDLRSGVPVLNKIPLVSFIFERKGKFVTNQKLLILVKANIVIPQELEPTAAQLGLEDSPNPSPRR